MIKKILTIVPIVLSIAIVLSLFINNSILSRSSEFNILEKKYINESNK